MMTATSRSSEHAAAISIDFGDGSFDSAQALGTEAHVVMDIAKRQEIGIVKYGTTVAENPLVLKGWLVHAYQEALDQAIYLKRAIEEIDGFGMWRSIATAPRDGRGILLWGEGIKEPVVGRWSTEHTSIREWWVDSWSPPGFDGPTHWMPLPSRPTEGQSG